MQKKHREGSPTQRSGEELAGEVATDGVFSTTRAYCHFFFFYIYSFLRDRDRAQVGEGQREGDTESEAGSRLRAVSTEPHAGLELTNCEIMT